MWMDLTVMQHSIQNCKASFNVVQFLIADVPPPWGGWGWGCSPVVYQGWQSAGMTDQQSPGRPSHVISVWKFTIGQRQLICRSTPEGGPID